MRYSCLNFKEINKALNSKGALNKRIVDAVRARMEIDLKSGATITRFQSLSVRNIFKEHEMILSYGTGSNSQI